jgi:hypothetical protein
MPHYLSILLSWKGHITHIFHPINLIHQSDYPLWSRSWAWYFSYPSAIAFTIYSKKAGSKYGSGATASFNVECYNVSHLLFIPFMYCLSIWFSLFFCFIVMIFLKKNLFILFFNIGIAENLALSFIYFYFVFLWD